MFSSPSRTSRWCSRRYDFATLQQLSFGASMSNAWSSGRRKSMLRDETSVVCLLEELGMGMRKKTWRCVRQVSRLFGIPNIFASNANELFAFFSGLGFWEGSICITHMLNYVGHYQRLQSQCMEWKAAAARSHRLSPLVHFSFLFLAENSSVVFAVIETSMLKLSFNFWNTFVLYYQFSLMLLDKYYVRLNGVQYTRFSFQPWEEEKSQPFFDFHTSTSKETKSWNPTNVKEHTTKRTNQPSKHFQVQIDWLPYLPPTHHRCKSQSLIKPLSSCRTQRHISKPDLLDKQPHLDDHEYTPTSSPPQPLHLNPKSSAIPQLHSQIKTQPIESSSLALSPQFPQWKSVWHSQLTIDIDNF